MFAILPLIFIQRGGKSSVTKKATSDAMARRPSQYGHFADMVEPCGNRRHATLRRRNWHDRRRSSDTKHLNRANLFTLS